MKILVLGAGGREHALVDTFKRQGHQVYALPGNAGIERTAFQTLELPLKDFQALAEAVKKEGVELTVVGAEVPLAEGIVNVFQDEKLAIFGPTKEAAIMESSKCWAKQFMQKYQIPTADFQVFHSKEEAETAVKPLLERWGGLVVKADGLCNGTGVTICKSEAEAMEALTCHMVQGTTVVLEEALPGIEVCMQAFCDGKSLRLMPTTQDHQQLDEGGEGVNTGGLGAYAPVPFITAQLQKEIEETILKPTLDGMQKEGIKYQGVLYFGLMLSNKGPKVLEYNCRFGDPEAQAVLPLLESDLAETMLACMHGKLEERKIKWSRKSTCCVILAAEGYPESPKTGHRIQGLEDVQMLPDLRVYHSGTITDPRGYMTTAGGRVLGITALAPSLDEAVKNSYKAVNMIHFHEMYFRTDVGQEALESEVARAFN
jgi:phosphoribosylamine--glycine ligase